MKAATAWRAGAATDPGLERTVNEDRILVDDARGLFLVVDGLGGHAAGELAAETAVRVIDAQLSAPTLQPEQQIRQAITAANNEIYELAQTDPGHRGMACVLTLAVAAGERIVIGHVGDSRLYVVWNGTLLKVTSDHSPIGELEDNGQLTEEQAMRHPRRNEVFRDVGSRRREPNDPDFIETKSVPFRPDAAFLICSDGLTDLVPAARIAEIVEGYDGDAVRIAQLLVEAANAAGGRDNISAVFVPGPDFIGNSSSKMDKVRARHATTRMRGERSSSWGVGRTVAVLLIGMFLGAVLWRVSDRFLYRPPTPPAAAPEHTPKDIDVEPGDSLGIIKALATALPGDVINVPPGEYLGPLQLKNRVAILSTAAHEAIVRSDPASSVEPGVAIVAHGVSVGRLKGLRIAGDETHPLRTGLFIDNSSIEVDDLEISGAIDAGLQIQGDSHAVLLGNFIHANSGPGVVVHSPATPRLVGNQVSENGAPSQFPPSLDKEIRAGNTIDPPARNVKPKKQAKPPSQPRSPLDSLPSGARI